MNTGFEILTQPFQLDFMRDAMLIALMVAVPSALLSCFLVLKGWSLMGDATSHAVLPGIVIAYMAGLPLAGGAFVAGMVSAVATGYLKGNSRIKQDTIMGVVFSGMFGLGLVLFVKVESSVHLDHILFGDILGVDASDMIQTGIIAAAVSAVLLLKWPDFLLHAFDPVQARAMGLPLGRLHYGFLAIVSLTIVAALKAVGIILVIALLIAPGATAHLLARRFVPMMALAVGMAASTSILGVYASFYMDSAPAPTIVVLMSLVFVLAFLASRPRPRRREDREEGEGTGAALN